MLRLTASVALLLQATVVSSSVIDGRADGSGIDRRDIFGRVVPRDVFKANPTCPTDREAFKAHKAANKVEALDELLYGCMPRSLRGQLYPSFDDSNQNTLDDGDGNSIARRGVDSNTVQEKQKSTQSCEEITRAWGCVRGLDCHYSQACRKSGLQSLHREILKLDGAELIPCGNQPKPREMHCRMLRNPVAAEEVMFDRLSIDIVLGGGKGDAPAGKIFAEVGGSARASIFDGVFNENEAMVPINVPEMFDGESEFSLKQVMQHRVKLHYLPAGSRGGELIQIRSLTMFARLKGTNILFNTTPLRDQKFQSARGGSVLWSHQLDFGGWNAVVGFQKPPSPFQCLSTESMDECSDRLRYG
ncbi:hypothetical protein DCS_02521 [Drechmeria coniospora]|uniref:Uncharacterized protein n=1 Tax=Drechmeria coniospora TaxID=98403 RepID=A0A151GWA0_DRECN|nr:hypothetical protein DCS_02521 [Drechmeria coniospora]KYK61379.1 hypothetical protein DCS_02521 [Drechmeria coniospora]ODA81140.1 hypothetical protein RJ55_04104 [Drechmeria coniospora]